MTIEDLFEARSVSSALTRTEFVLRGGRYHLFLLRGGAATVVAGDGEHRLSARGLSWLPNGAGRRVALEAGSQALMLSIPDAGLGRSIPGEILGHQVRHIVGLVHHVPQTEPEIFQSILQQMLLIERELAANRPGMDVILQNSVSCLLVELWRLSGAETIQPLSLPVNIVHTFVSLLDVHLRDHWSVAQYAAHMGISRDRLTSVLRRATGEPPLALIHARMIAEAKTLLTSSGLQVSEIAFLLGYNDPAYFNRFFQRHVGTTPARFRREWRKPVAVEADSFAAWP